MDESLASIGLVEQYDFSWFGNHSLASALN